MRPEPEQLRRNDGALQNQYCRIGGSPIIHKKVWVGIELEILENFLETAVRTTEEEAAEIEARYYNEVNSGPDDLANEMMIPCGRLDIALRAVYHELVSIVEHELQQLAFEPWLQIYGRTRPPLPDGPELSPEFDEWLKREVSDRRFGQIVSMVQGHYKVELSKLDRWFTVEQVRSIGNDLKHRKGRIDRRPEMHNRSRLEIHELTVEDTKLAIAGTEAFLNALWEATDTGYR